MIEAALSGDLAEARREHYRLFPLMKLMFKSPSPGPAKKALELLGRIQDDRPRLPMTPADEQTAQALVEEMSRLGML